MSMPCRQNMLDYALFRLLGAPSGALFSMPGRLMPSYRPRTGRARDDDFAPFIYMLPGAISSASHDISASSGFGHTRDIWAADAASTRLQDGADSDSGGRRAHFGDDIIFMMRLAGTPPFARQRGKAPRHVGHYAFRGQRFLHTAAHYAVVARSKPRRGMPISWRITYQPSGADSLMIAARAAMGAAAATPPLAYGLSIHADVHVTTGTPPLYTHAVTCRDGRCAQRFNISADAMSWRRAPGALAYITVSLISISHSMVYRLSHFISR